MATDITMPKLSDTMTEGRLISWKKGVGDRVERGDVIAEVETDKATMELEAFAPGFLIETRAQAGEMVAVGTVIGIIGESGEKVALVPGAVQQEEPHEPQPAVGRPKEEPEAVRAEQQPESARPEKEPETVGAEAPEPAPAPVEERKEPPAEPPQPDREVEERSKEPEGEGGEPERASPLVRRLAREHGIDLRHVSGSGPEGRILREDVEKVIKGAGGEKQGAPLSPAPAGPTPGSTIPLSRMRRAIARTVSESWRTVPHFTITVRIDMGKAETVYRGLKESGKQLSLNDLVVKAAALALERFPLVNGSFTEEGIVVHPDINIGIAVSLAEGLVVPVIRECRRLSLVEIAERSRELVLRARSGKLSETDLSGGTFSISNLGMYGIDEFMAVILPPQGAILAVGAIGDEAVVENGCVVPRRVMRTTLSADHRLLDGAYAAQFLAEVRRILENPVTMLV